MAKASLATLHGILGSKSPDDADEPDPKDDSAKRKATVQELISAIKADDLEGADEALHSYVTQCDAEEPSDEGDEEPEAEPEDGEE
jgi:hypothetical protein